MDIRTLMNRLDNIEQNSGIKRYISEGLYNTPEMRPHWKRIDEGFVRGYEQYLAEVALTPDQIQNIFKQAAGGAAGGDAAKDPGKLAALVDKVLPSSQAGNLEKSLPEPNAGPVQGFEQKAAAAVEALPGVDSGTKQSLMQMVKAGIKKPETQQLILAAVGAGLGSLISKVGPILSMIPGGGPVASAITGAVVAGGVAVIAAKLRGEDWKSAFKGAIKPALMGGASAVVGNLVTTAVSAMASGGGQQPPAGEEPQQKRGAASGDMKPGDYDKMSQVPSNSDGTPMTPDEISQAKYQHAKYGAEKVLPVAGGDTLPDGTPIERTHGNSSPEYMAKFGGEQPNQGSSSVDDAVYQQAKAAGATGSSSSQQFTGADAKDQAFGKVRANLDQWRQDTGSPNAPNSSGIEPRGGYGAQEKINAMMQAKADAEYAAQQGAPADASASNQGRLKMNQWRQDVGSPNAIGSNFDAGIAPLGPDGSPMKAVPMDTGPTAGGVPVGSTPAGINRLTGQPISSGPTWDQMTPDQQAATTARQQQQAADAAQGTQNAKDYWANKNPNTRGLKESFAESAYVDKQATLKMWLEQEAKGLAVSGLALKPTVKEGIMDSIKGMFGGKKGAAAPAAGGGVTADALNKAWTAAGSPTDSEEVAKVLQGAGVAPDAVNKIFAD
jgi:hypothetical protein